MKHLLFTSALAMLLFSCKKNDDSTPTPTNPPLPAVPYSISDYTKLTVGNYWIYKELNIAPAPFADTTFVGTDSCYVKYDTVYNGNTYAVLIGYPGIYGGRILLRDSLNFLVNQHGIIYFTSSDFNTILVEDSVPGHSITTYGVSSIQTTITVPMGTYVCYNYLETIIIATFNSFQYFNTYYAANIGPVKFITQYILDEPNTLQYWLVRAHVI